ncbi:hypothetical protein [Paraburkholderia fungorum]|uniref:hypothetical protein n=1 Tax=Paraburkholderia fungorum TaxID=134537 RepID=UPI0038BC3320
MADPTIYSISQAPHRGTMDVAQVWTQAAGELPTGLNQLVSTPWKGGALLIGSTPAGVLSFWTLNATAPFVISAGAAVDLATPVDLLRAFVLGGVTYLLGYGAVKGVLRFVALKDDLTLSRPTDYSRTRPPAVTPGWTEAYPVTYLSKQYLVSYDSVNGGVNLFSLVIVGSNADPAPIEVDNVWAWSWAKGWTRFAFFTLGGENFFLKTNTARLNVNIDHLNLDPNTRSSEVLTFAQNALPNAASLEIVRPFTLTGGAPGFLVYQSGQPIQFYNIWPNCQGWDNEAQLPATTGLTQIVIYAINNQSYALFY